MSGKFEKKKQSSGEKSRKSKASNSGRILWTALVILAILLVIGIAVLITMDQKAPSEGENPIISYPSTENTEPVRTTEAPVQLEAVEEVSMSLDKGLEIVDIGSYTGIYMEDGSDEIVSGILMIVVTNTSDTAVQYAEISLSAGDETAYFSLSTLPAGASVVLLEQNRMSYSSEVEYTDPASRNVALFSGELSLCEDLIGIQTLDGAFNITNISGEDITGDIVIYYKNSAADVYYGGITYRVRLEGGMKADEVRQIMASHFNGSGSTIMFVTCG